MIKCLLTHKCSPHTHALAESIQAEFRRAGVLLEVDPFLPADSIISRVESLHPEALVLLCSPEALLSPMCQMELAVAKAEGLPIGIIRQSGEVPRELRDRLYVDLTVGNPKGTDESLLQLGSAMRLRGEFLRKLRTLDQAAPSDIVIAAAQDIAASADALLLNEFLDSVLRQYASAEDPSVRFWLAMAIGRAGGSRAADALIGLLGESHPYPREGIRLAFRSLPLSTAEQALSGAIPRMAAERARLALAILQSLTGKRREDQ